MSHTASQNNRETWLKDALYDFVRPLIEDAGYDVPINIRVGCGWPSKSALSAKKRRVGEAWSPKCSEDQSHEIIISACVAEPAEVLDILVHEVVHAVVGVEHGHKKPFSQCAKAVGLVKPWTATKPSAELTERINAYLTDAEPYPHAKLDKAPQQRKQTTRMILLECVCGLKTRTTQKWIDEYGPQWPCPCGGELVLQEPSIRLDD